MVTTVGTAADVIDMLNDLIELNYDTIYAYETVMLTKQQSAASTTASISTSSRRSRRTTSGTYGNWTA